MYSFHFLQASRSAHRLAAASATLALVTACGGGGGGSTSEMPPAIKAWRGATLVETSAEDADSPQVSHAGTGDWLAVWQQHDGTRYQVWVNRYRTNTGWGAHEAIDLAGGGNALYPQIAADGAGHALAVWDQGSLTSLRSIWANRYDASTGWGTPEQVSGAVLLDSNAERAQVAVDSSGRALVVWEQRSGTRVSIAANRYTPGTGWGTPELIETDDTGNATDAQIAMDSSGHALAVWSQSNGALFSVWSNRFSPATGWGTAELVETGSAGDASRPQIAVDPGGNAIAVWDQGSGVRTDVWANRYEVGSGWGAPELIETDSAGDADSAQIAFGTSGHALAVWHQSDGTRFNIVANRYSAGSGWGSAQRVNIEDARDARRPQIALDASGEAVAVWQQDDGMRVNTWANRYSPTTGWGTAELIETENLGNVGMPQVATDGSGHALAIWHQTDGTVFSIWANSFQ
jgi:hypothetical protein